MVIPVPAAGPHGLAVDQAGRLYGACAVGHLLVLAPPTYKVMAARPLAGAPDLIILDPTLHQLDRHRVDAFLPATHRAAVFAARA
ncbi:MAG: hypothetical protein ACP5VP_09350 [Candidatus Limnocylindrales bacterium]